MTNPDLSVVIVHYNTPDLLRQCIHSIETYTRGVSYELIVVDNASVMRADPAHFHGVHWIQSDENLGFGVANNVGARQAQGKYLLLLNSDTQLMNNLLLALYQVACDSEPFGIIAPRLLNPDQSTQFYGSVFGRWQYLGVKPRSVSFVSGAAMMISRELFMSIGGFDERFFFYNEDVDLCKTIRRKGFPIFYVPAITVIHLGGQSTKKSLKLQWQAFQSSWYFFRKHYLFFVFCMMVMNPFAFSGMVLYKIPSVESISYESYTVLPGEQMGVGGFLYQRFITPEWYWGGAGYGALTGERGGYFIGGFILGTHYEWQRWVLEPQLFLGGGGGHGAPQGGGGIVRTSLSLGYRLNNALTVMIYAGYIDFVNGQIKSNLMGVSVGYHYHDLVAK